MTRYVVDTHALIFYLGAPVRLGSAACRAFAEAVAGQAEIIVPVVVLAELVFAVERGRVQLDIPRLITQMQALPYFRIVLLTLARVLDLRTTTGIPELHDRMIVCETLVHNGTLITRDARVRHSDVVPTIW